MKRTVDLSSLPMSPAVRKLNAHLFGATVKQSLQVRGKIVPAKKTRLRQSSKPKLNSNETAFEAHLRATLGGAFIHAQDVHLQLANGVRYTPDFMTYEPFSGRVCFWEVKGTRKIFDGAGEKLKTAARLYKWAVFHLVWFEAGAWQQQRILP
jgi:hypothetical protein